MKLKKMLIVLLLACVSNVSFGQEASPEGEGVKFLDGYTVTYSQALADAKKESKLLFIDCYTTWCGPCKMMIRDVFSLKMVGDYFAPRFVSIKFDMEKGEGLELRKKFDVKAYPTFLIIDPQKNTELTRIVGGDKADKFVETIETNLKAGGLSAYDEKYAAGERSEEFVLAYIKMLSGAYKSEKCAEVAEAYLVGKESQLLTNQALYDMFMQHITSADSPLFMYVVDRKVEFSQKYDEKKLNRKLQMVWESFPQKYLVKKDDGTLVFDQAGMDQYVLKMKKYDVQNIDRICLSTDMYVAQQQAKWPTYLELCKQYVDQNGKSHFLIYNYALRIERGCKDEAVRRNTAEWLKTSKVSLEEELQKEPAMDEAKKKGLTGYLTSYEGLIAKLDK